MLVEGSKRHFITRRGAAESADSARSNCRFLHSLHFVTVGRNDSGDSGFLLSSQAELGWGTHLWDGLDDTQFAEEEGVVKGDFFEVVVAAAGAAVAGFHVGDK